MTGKSDGEDWRHAGEGVCPQPLPRRHIGNMTVPGQSGHVGDRPRPPVSERTYLLYCCRDPSDIKGNMLDTVLTAFMCLSFYVI